MVSQVVNIHSVLNGATSASEGLTKGITVSGFDPNQTLSLTLPPSQLYTAWQPHGAGGNYVNAFAVVKDGNPSLQVSFGGFIDVATATEARTAFGVAKISGASSYTFYIYDDPIDDNAGGLSVYIDDGSRLLFRLSSPVISDGSTNQLVDVSDGTIYPLSKYTPADIPIAEILTHLSLYSGYTNAQIATEGLDGYTCKGLFIDRDASVQDICLVICELYSIDIVESGDQIKFVRKATDGSYAADVTIPESELVAIPVDDSTAYVLSSRQYENDVPFELEVRYVDSGSDFEIQPQVAQRPNGAFEVTLSSRKETISVPLVLTANDAKRRIVERLYSWVSAQNTNRVILPPEHIAVEPSDILEITADDVTRTVKVTRSTARADYTQELDVLEFLTEAETSAIGGTSVINSSVNSTYLQPSRYIHLDVPLLRYQHDTIGASLVQYHVITGRGQAGWSVGHVWRSLPGGTWESVDALSGSYPTVAVCTNALGTPPVDWSTDYQNTLTLRLIAGSASDIATATYANVMAGSNYAAVGRPGRWEIIQWIDVETNADGTITISQIVRGQRGTEIYGSTHTVGDFFVVLSPAYYDELYYNTSDLDTTYFYKAVGKNHDFDIVPIDTHTITGAAETPYAPSNLDAVIDGSDIDLSWTRRTRLSSPWKDGGSSVEGPLGETTKLYDIEILDGPGGSVLRTFSNVTTESKVYTAANITTDFGSMPSILTYAAYQLSEIIGRGHRAEATIALS